MNKFKKVFSFFIIVIFSLSFYGCFSYRDINKIVFVTSVLYDVDNDGKIVTYLECFKPYRSSSSASEKGQRLIFRGIGKTALEASRDINLSSSYIINYTQNKAIIFTNKVAEYGLSNYIDFINRDQELIVRPNVYVFFGDPEKLMKLKIKDEEYIGLNLNFLIENIGVSSRALKSSLNDYLVKRSLGNKIAVLTAIEIKKQDVEERLTISGGAILQNDKMVERINVAQGQGYNFLTNNVRRGTLEVTNPDNPEKFVTLEILKNITKTEIHYDGKNINLIKKIHVKTTIAEAQGNLNFSSDNFKKLQKSAEDNIKRYTEIIFEEFKKKELDIFEIEQDFHRKYSRVKINNPISITNLRIEPYVYIEGSSNINNTI